MCLFLLSLCMQTCATVYAVFVEYVQEGEFPALSPLLTLASLGAARGDS